LLVSAAVFVLSCALFARNACADINDDLVAAVKRGDVSAVERLLNEGANPNAASGNGVSALMEASRDGNIGIIKKLVDADADVSTVDKDGMSAASYAARNGRKYALDELLNSGATLADEGGSEKTLSDHARESGFQHIAEGLDSKSEGMAQNIAEMRNRMLDESRGGEFGSAADIAKEIYGQTRTLYGDKDPRTIAALNDLALMSMRAGRRKEAGEYYELAYELSKDAFGKTSRETAVAANNLGVFHYSQSNRHAASGYFSEAYNTSIKLGDTDELTEEFSKNLALAEGGVSDGEPGSSTPSMPGNEPVGTTTWGEARTQHRSPALRGGGSGVLGSVDTDMFEVGWFGISDDQMTILFNLMIVLLSLLVGYFVYRLLNATLWASEQREAYAVFDAKMNMGYAKFLERVDRYPSAANHFERALIVFDKDVMARFRLARIYEKMGETSKAKRHYRHVISLLPPEHALRRDAFDSILRMN
jgi:tetratricopeptide (TPR) repeat protein